MIKLFDSADFPIGDYISHFDKRVYIRGALKASLLYQLTKNSDTYYCHKWFGQIKINLKTIIFKEQYEIFTNTINKLYYDMANDMMLINDDLAIKMS